MTTRTHPLTPEQFDGDQAALYATIVGGPRSRGPQHFALTAEDGSLRGPFDLMLRAPVIGAAQQELGAAIRYRTTLGDRERELAILLVAAHRGSGFERESHEAVARALGFDEVELEAIRRLDVAVFAGEERLVAQASVELLDGDLSTPTWEALRSALGERGVFELTALIGYYSTLALQLRVFRAE